ncbi:MAG TPA: DUF262 domain-containing protein [Pirellulales bacterium]|nr:DUF262 domain-containing protein [Pirellulales bacterium]
MAYESVKIREVVERAVAHSWSIPEFQRGFVWKSTQVRDLAESLWYDYPIGSILVWNSTGPAEEQVARDAQRPRLWVVDGQQRTTALCILSGRKPYWWPTAEEWHKTLKKYDIRFDVHAKEPPFFLVANAAIRKAHGDRYVPLTKLLVLDTAKEQDQKSLEGLAKAVKLQGFCDSMDAMEVYTRLDRVRKIREKEMVTITVDHELEDVVEIFSRLNSRGTRVTEADIYLGVVAARNPGWVRDTFLPYLKQLAQVGFDLDPNLLFRCITGVGSRRVRFREIADSFWDADSVVPVWMRTQEAWKRLISRFREFGILSNRPMPTEAALVTMISLIDKFDDQNKFSLSLYWFLQASRFGRYSGSGTTSLEEDLREIHEAGSLEEAVKRLIKRVSVPDTPFKPEDFYEREYTAGRFWPFFMYLLAYRRKAQDWDEHGHRIGFEGAELLADFRPQFHHIFPKKYLEGNVDDSLIDAVANIAVIGPSINIRISAKSPLDYVERYQITPDKLRQQLIDPEFTKVSFTGFDGWLRQRAEALANAGNEFMAELKGSL